MIGESWTKSTERDHTTPSTTGDPVSATVASGETLGRTEPPDTRVTRPLETLQLRWGNVSLVVPARDHGVFYSTFVTRVYAALALRPGDTVLDAGAHVGDFTVWASHRVGSQGLVIAVEPNPRLYRLLELNLARNHCSNVRSVNRAIGKGEKRRLMIDDGVGTRFGREDGEGSFSIQCSSVYEILKECGCDRLDIVKMDIEGAETEAMSSLTTLHSIRSLMIELHSHAASDAIRSALLAEGFLIRTSSLIDVAAETLYSALTRPVALARAEVTTQAFLLRSMLRVLTDGRQAVPFLNDRAGISMICARARAVP